jgi:hypothetical protein
VSGPQGAVNSMAMLRSTANPTRENNACHDEARKTL